MTDEIKALVSKEVSRQLKNYVNPQFLNITQSAKYLGVSYATFNRWRNSGEFNVSPVVIGDVQCFDTADLDKFMIRRKEY